MVTTREGSSPPVKVYPKIFDIFSYGMAKYNKCILLMTVNNEHLFVAWDVKKQGNCPEGKEMLAFETEHGQNPKLDLSSFLASGDFCRLLLTLQTEQSALIWGRLDLAVLFTPSTPNRQNRNQVHWNICAGVRRSTPSTEVVQTEQSRDLFQKRWRIIACMLGNISYRLINSGVLQSAQFYLFTWLFWRTLSTLKIAKSSPPLDQNRLIL